jgi:hypothetical protein
MKGLLWITVSLITALVIVGWASYMLYGQINDFTKMNAKYQALEVAGIINMLQASPKETDHDYVPPFCAEITGDREVKIGDLAVIEMINTSVRIEQGSIGCNGDEYLAREDSIKVKAA